jgi:hypothetical protein
MGDEVSRGVIARLSARSYAYTGKDGQGSVSRNYFSFRQRADLSQVENPICWSTRVCPIPFLRCGILRSLTPFISTHLLFRHPALETKEK